MKTETKKKTGWIDVSRLISEETAVFPGDTSFSRSWVMSLAEGHACNTSTITLSAHTGTHVDAPVHFIHGAWTVDEIPVEAFIGRCRVVHAKEARCVQSSDFRGIDLEKEQRILFRTRRPLADHEWRDDFTYVSVDAARALTGLRLVGIDTPSVDPKNSKTLDAHKALLENKVAIIEGLNLEGVDAGVYELIAVPLRIKGGDASPVRALIRPWPDGGED